MNNAYSTTNDQVILVDQHDHEIGTAEKLHAHEHALLHRAFSVFVLEKRGDEIFTLLQQRHHEKYHCGGLWSNSCCSHPRPSENTADAAARRLFEEMGLSLALIAAGHFTYQAAFANGLIEHEYDHVFIAWYDNQAFRPNPNEVQQTRWIAINELYAALEKQTNDYTPWLKAALDLAYQQAQLTY